MMELHELARDYVVGFFAYLYPHAPMDSQPPAEIFRKAQYQAIRWADEHPGASLLEAQIAGAAAAQRLPPNTKD